MVKETTMEYTNAITTVNDKIWAEVLWENEKVKSTIKQVFKTELAAQAWITNTTQSIQDNDGVLVAQPYIDPTTGKIYSEAEEPEFFSVYNTNMEILKNSTDQEERAQASQAIKTLINSI
jgi:type IV secretory pathway VirB4 component